MALRDKVVVITGAARGMGREYALGFLDEGSRVVATDLSWEGDGAEDVKQSIEESGHGMTRVMDITKEDDIAQVGLGDRPAHEVHPIGNNDFRGIAREVAAPW